MARHGAASILLLLARHLFHYSSHAPGPPTTPGSLVGAQWIQRRHLAPVPEPAIFNIYQPLHPRQLWEEAPDVEGRAVVAWHAHEAVVGPHAIAWVWPGDPGTHFVRHCNQLADMIRCMESISPLEHVSSHYVCLSLPVCVSGSPCFETYCLTISHCLVPRCFESAVCSQALMFASSKHRAAMSYVEIRSSHAIQIPV